jgi:PncC family amidohydrolase
MRLQFLIWKVYEMKRLEADVAKLIRAIEAKTGKHIMIGSVESATGGRIADRITNISGSADYFKGTIVSYNNDIKTRVVGVKEETLKLHGAVSHETAKEMAEGGLKLLRLDFCISTTGIAGPTGATPVKPVGLFYLGLASATGTSSYKHIFKGKREEIKEKATRAALQLLKNELENKLDTLKDIQLEEKHVVTCFLEHQKMILILRRSGKVGTYKRAWAGVSGYLESDPLDQAYTEIREETGLFKSSVKLITTGRPLEIIDKDINKKWIVHPFLFHVTDPERLKIDWEHTEFKWIKPHDLSKYKTVPGLKAALGSVLD